MRRCLKMSSKSPGFKVFDPALKSVCLCKATRLLRVGFGVNRPISAEHASLSWRVFVAELDSTSVMA